MTKQQNNFLQKRTKYLLTIIALTFFGAILFSKTETVHASPRTILFKKGTKIETIKEKLGESFKEIAPKNIATFFQKSNIRASSSKITQQASVIIDDQAKTIQVETQRTFSYADGKSLTLVQVQAKLSAEKLTESVNNVIRFRSQRDRQLIIDTHSI